MNNQPKPDEYLYQLDDLKLRTVQIISFALFMGAFSFFAVIILIYGFTVGEQSDSSLDDVILGLTGFTLLTTIVAYPLSYRLFINKLKSSKDAQSFTDNLLPAYTFRFAVLEGVALLGLTALLLAVIDNSLSDNLTYWINTLPLLVMALVVGTNFPTKTKIKLLYEEFVYMRRS